MPCVSQKKKENNMSVLDCLDRVVIIDDSPEEVESLKQLLVNNDISVDCYTPDVARSISLKKNRQLFFIDLSMDESKSIKDNISTIIRPLLKRMISMNFGTYGLIMWTKHFEWLEEVKNKIQLDKDKYQLPLFILGLDKSKYLKEGNFNKLFTDIDELIENNNAAYFFFNWRQSVHSGVDRTIFDIYKLAPNYITQEIELSYLMYKMALNYTGIQEEQLGEYNLSLDTYKSFDELLYSDLIAQQKSDSKKLFKENMDNPWQENIENSVKKYSILNSKFLIDEINLEQNIVVPGNIYKIVEDNHLLKINGAPKTSERIAIELTPPCDFSHKKVVSRLVAGFIVECPMKEDKIQKYIKSFKGDNKYTVWPIHFNEKDRFICFDFRYTDGIDDIALKDSSRYKLIFRVKHRLFADILQKFSSHAARLGLAIIQPEVKEEINKK